MTNITINKKNLLCRGDVQEWIKKTEDAVRKTEVEDGISRLLIVNEGDVLDIGTTKIEMPIFR